MSYLGAKSPWIRRGSGERYYTVRLLMINTYALISAILSASLGILGVSMYESYDPRFDWGFALIMLGLTFMGKDAKKS